MTNHKTGTREEWFQARLELLDAEKELTRRSDELARQRQELPWVRIDKDYRFETDAGSASLAELFQGRSQLLVYHFMFGPDYTAGCPLCSAIADGFDGFVVHLAIYDEATRVKTALLRISAVSLPRGDARLRRQGWRWFHSSIRPRMARVSVRSARGLNQPVGLPVEATANAEFARAAAASRRRISPSRRP
jgi:predicted dithiol-disulfide oxidoreductase (DUF899 family)